LALCPLDFSFLCINLFTKMFMYISYEITLSLINKRNTFSSWVQSAALLCFILYSLYNI
jgi:hypothetical protein